MNTSDSPQITQSQVLTDVLVKLHADQTLLEEQHKKTEDKLTEMVKKLEDHTLTSDQLTSIREEFSAALQEFDQTVIVIQEHIQQVTTQNAL